MQLCFLGQAYSTSNHRVDTVPISHTAHFLGQSYTLRRPLQTFTAPLGLKKYRGVSYSAE